MLFEGFMAQYYISCEVLWCVGSCDVPEIKTVKEVVGKDIFNTDHLLMHINLAILFCFYVIVRDLPGGSLRI